MIRFILCLFFVLSLSCLPVGSLQAQLIGGRQVYKFLDISNSARLSGLGGNLITVMDDDIHLASKNPSALNEQMHQQIGFSHSFLFEGVGNSYVGYGHHVDKWNTTLHAGLQYINYGEFERTNEFFQSEGTFQASEFAFTVGAGRQIDERLHLGTNVKVISSQFDIYQSFGVAADAALFYQDTARNFTASLVFKNMGTQLSTYEEGTNEPLPFEIQFGISKRLRYLPFRFSVIYEHLQSWNILYDDPNLEQGIIFIGEDSGQSGDNTFINNLFRHFVFNGELLVGAKENFRLRFGYRHILRQELSVDSFGSLAGFSFGVGFRVNRFKIDYGLYNMHIAGGVNQLSISTNIKEFKK
ncbi:MAG: type IX secretion system protein PorQ [Bacteroidota bacterium]